MDVAKRQLLNSSAMKVINSDLVVYKQQMNATADNFATVDNEYKYQARFRGLCPYGHDQAFWYDPKVNKLYKGTFKAGNLTAKQELALTYRADEVVTMMEIIGKYLAVGFFDGSIDIISLENKDLATILTIKQKEGAHGFVRDIHIHHAQTNGDLCLLVLFVDQKATKRTLSMAHYVLSQNFELKRSSETVKIYSVLNTDKVHKLQHRVEFYWWE